MKTFEGEVVVEKVSAWIVSVVCAVLLGVLVEVVLPSGRLSKLLKIVVSLLVMIVIVSPIKDVDLKNFGIENFFGGLKIDQNFVDERNKDEVENIQNQIVENLSKNGYFKVAIKIEGSFESDGLKIKAVVVDLENLVLKDESLNINKYTNISEIIKSVVNVENEKVIFYE